MTESEARNLALSLMAKHYLVRWNFDFNNRIGSIGVCDYQKKTIYLSRYYLNIDGVDIRDTILHEIAHALCPGDGHGSLWKKTCIQIGATPERCVKVTRVAPKNKSFYKACCKSCGTEYNKYRLLKRSYSCPVCANSYNEKYKLVFEKIE
jgi:predicted SprT family Zn-dependent metalloprotease